MKKFLILFTCLIFAAFAGVSYASEEAVVVISYAGDVKVIPAGSSEPVTCKPGMVLKEGTRIITGEESYLKVAFDKPERNVVKVEEKSEMVIKLDGDDKIELIDGKIFASLQDLTKGETFRVRTPCATCGARGTGWITETDGKTTDVFVYDGTIFVRGINKDGTVMEKEYLVEEGFQRKVRKFKRPEREKKIPERKLTRIKVEAKPLIGVRHLSRKDQEEINPLIGVPKEVIEDVIKDTGELVGLRKEPVAEKPEIIEVDRVEIIERIERSDDIPENLERLERTEVFERPGIMERPEIFTRDDKPERVERPERPEKMERIERIERIDRPRVLDNNLQDRITDK